MLALEQGTIPATLGTVEIDPRLPACHVVTRTEPLTAPAALLLAESFAGRCAALVVTRAEDA